MQAPGSATAARTGLTLTVPRHICLVSVLISGLVLLLFPICTLHAQDSDETNTSGEENDTELPPGEYTFSAGSIESWKVDKTTRAFLLSGGAELKRKNERLTATRIIGWATEEGSEDGAPLPETLKLERVYAEQDVLYWKNEEFLQGERLFLNLKENTGVARNVTYRNYDRKNDIPVVVRSDRLVQVEEGVYEATGVQFTTCDYADPHYDINASTLRIWNNGEDGETSIAATQLVPQFRDVPFGYWPYLYARSSSDLGPLKQVEYGENDRFGTFVKTLWGFNFSSLRRDPDGNAVRDKNNNKVYNYNVDLDVQLDYRERRGLAGGPQVDYEAGKHHEGFLYGYLMNDLKGPNPDNDFDRQFLPQVKDHRGRAWWFHRYDLIGTAGDVHQLRLDTEVNNVSDRHFMEEFLETEFKTGKERETYSKLRYVDENTYGSVLTRYRLNSFQTQTEYMPGLTYAMKGEPVPETPFVYSSDTNLANLRRRRDRFSPDPDFRTERFDTYQEIAYPFPIGPLRARAFTGGRFTQYQDDPGEDDDISRHLLSGGMQLFDQLHRTFPVESETLGLNGLRHIFSWDVRYTNNVESSHASDSVPRFDTRDPLDEHEEIYLGVRNRFQTRTDPSGGDQDKKRKRNSGNRPENRPEDSDDSAPDDAPEEDVHEFLSFGAAIEHYPKSDRDRSRIREQNHLAPSTWITGVRSPRTGEVRDDNLSLLHLDYQFDPKLPFSLSGDYEINLEAENFDATTTRLSVFPGRNVSGSLTYSFVRELTETVNASVHIPLSDHWIFSGTTSYDLERSDSRDIQLDLGYRLHDFIIRFSSKFDDRRDDRQFTVSVAPKFANLNLFDVTQPGPQ